MKVTTVHIPFVSSQNTLSGTLFAPSGKLNSPGVIFLHGGGTATGKLYHPWQEYLAEHGISSFSFDFRGVGESEGAFADGSLQNRLLDAQQALQTFQATDYVDSKRIAIAGNSMGAHVVVQLAHQNPLTPAIILGCAAAYAKDAEDKPLNEAFTKVIRKKDSWKSTTNFAILEAFGGKILTFYGEHEDIIPKELQKRIEQISKSKGDATILPHLGHRLLTVDSRDQAQSQQQMFAQSVVFLNNAL